ncbi:acyl-CoA dehydrogenase family protein [Nocardioides caeni]|uniref:Acyl-CoA dehydrogenase n=1 Tax=Nocardioides caeni TaxID=574700 RepID=A0A4S8NFG9_9ACTN|nr:acyl-CoA dehydrogenase family protein [Nocardioides caeni]THV14761.1 acyl-CoA dehydrogenase [Nocardioides caeni]
MIATEAPEIADVRAVAADFFARHRISLDDDGSPRYERDQWRRACNDLGVAAILEPEDDGGLEGGAAMLAAVLVEAGRSLSPLPLMSSAVLAQTALRLVADHGARLELLEGLVTGQVVATLAPWEVSLSAVTAAEEEGRGWLLDGSLSRVIDGGLADLTLVLAPVVDGVGLFALAASDAQSWQEQRAVDLTRTFARVDLERAPARLLGVRPREVLEDLAHWRALALVSDQLGGAEACLDTTLDYLRTRVQFGRVLGSFQALKHQCADLALVVDDIRSALAHLVWALDESPADVPSAAAIATVAGSDGFVTCAEEMVHLHGGIGFTWEHDAHRYVRRALTDRGAFHDVRAAREALLVARGL